MEVNLESSNMQIIPNIEDRPTSERNNRNIFNSSIMEHREKLSAAQPILTAANVLFFDILIPIKGDVKISARIYVPKNPSEGNLPTVFYIPGTAFITSEIKFTHVICSQLCEMTNCQVIVINHRLAPENQFPKPFQDTYSTFKFFIQQMPAHFLIDKNRVAVIGYSSGGNFAANIALQATKDKISVAHQILISPILDLSRSLKDFKDFENQDKAISDEFVNFFLRLYVPEQYDMQNPKISPFWEQPQELKQLPRTTIILAKYDRFRSDGESYYTKLQFNGVNVDRYIASAEDHSYLWYKPEVIKKISDVLQETFKTPLNAQKKHQITFVEPTNDSNSAIIPTSIKAKL